MAHSPYDHDPDWEGEDDLELIQSDERLPWLEADEEDQGAPGLDPSRLVILALLSVVIVGALVAAAWFMLGAASNEPVADGSLIAAPEGPYKVRPEDAGGKIHPGTGDTSYAVGEGQTREGHLADKPRAAATPEVAGPSLASTLNEGPRAPEPAGVAVQVGAYPTREDANEAWVRLTRQTEALSGVRHRVVEAQVDIGTVYRLQAMAGNRAGATALCNRLKGDGLACFVK